MKLKLFDLSFIDGLRLNCWNRDGPLPLQGVVSWKMFPNMCIKTSADKVLKI